MKLLLAISNPIFLWIAAYSLTGIVSPTLVDYVSHKYDPEELAFLPGRKKKIHIMGADEDAVLATAIGLTLVLPLGKLFDSQNVNNNNPFTVIKPWDYKSALPVAVLDLLATSLVTVGLVNVGSATYTVIYSSAAAWTALISWYRGNPLNGSQVVGVTIVTAGLFLNGAGHIFEDETRTESGWFKFLASCICLLLGTVFHSIVMIRIDEFSKDSRTKALHLASTMGRIEIFALLVWNVGRILKTGFQKPIALGALLWYGILSINQSIHSLAFFSMIGSIGAVGSAVLKGFLALNTFGIAALLFCEQGHSENCLSPLKAMGLLFVLAGCTIFFLQKKKSTPLQQQGLPI